VELQLFSQSPDNQQSLSIYVIKNDEDIDLEKFAAADTMLFKNLGELVDSRKIREYLIVLKAIEKSYKTNGRTTKLLFQVKNNLGYVVVWQSSGQDILRYSEIADTFNVSWPFAKIVASWFTGIWSWILGIIFFLVGIGFLYLIGKTGQLVRRGVETKKALTIFKKEASREELEVNEKWHLYKKKSSLQIVVPVLGWGLLYFTLFFIFSLKIFLFSLLLLIPPFLGYFGIFFVPSEDPDDYI